MKLESLNRICATVLAISLPVVLAGPVRAQPEESATTHAAEPDTEAEHTTHTPISQGTDYDEILVTASPHSRRRFDVIQGTTVMSKERLERDIQTSIGETLSALPGISSTYYGPGASRPVIRGLDGPRIRVLQNGVGTLDASVTSPDHGVLADPLATHRIEVIRGAGTLMYGSSAIGGVVNVYDGRIPEELPGDVVEGDVRALYGSAAEEKSAGAGVTTALGPLAFRAAGFFRDTNALRIPGFAPSDRLLALDPGLPTGPHGIALNTDVDAKGGTLGTAWLGDSGTLGVAYGVSDSNYGVPTEIGEEIRIDLFQRRVDANGEWRGELFVFEEAAFKLAWASYEHIEIEGGLPGTRFENTGWEGRADLVQKPWGDLHGSAGYQFLVRDFSAIGAEAFVPPNETTSHGLFVVEEVHLGPVTLEGGLRWDRQHTTASSIAFDRTWNLVSFSAGAGWEVFDDYLLGLSLSRTERAPAPEELLSNGPHLATFGFDVGNLALVKEAGLTVEATARKRWGRWTGGVNFYWTRFSDFIYQQNVGRVDEDGNPDPNGELVLRPYLQQDADFIGTELQGAFEPIRHEHFTGVIEAQFDWVQATTRGGLENPLPRIPPLRVKGAVEGRSELADLRFEVWWVGEQERVSPLELPTDSYLMLSLIFTAHPFPDRRNVTFVVQGRNLTDAEARVHSSFLKDRLPLGGREARVGIKVSF